MFENIPSENYLLQLDTTTFHDNAAPLLFSAEVLLEGCGDMELAQFLVADLCPAPLSGIEQLTVCQGDSAFYNGVFIPAGTSQLFILNTFDGCDSVVTVQVAAMPPSSALLSLMGCPANPLFLVGKACRRAIPWSLT